MKNLVKILFLVFLLNTSNYYLAFADNSYFIDFSKVLNQSTAGAEAQQKLKEKLINENNKFLEEEKNLKKQENDLISQKKALSSEDYQKKVEDLRKKVSDLQNKKQNSLNSIAKSRNDARETLIKTVNPIIKKYMEQNNIRIVLNKESVILGDTNLEITDKIINILNQELKSLNIN